jgi:hypothetical protein
MGQLDTLHKCSLGTSDFQLEDFEYGKEPVVKDGLRVGDRVFIRGTGWVEAASATALATALAAAETPFSTSGDNVQIFGPQSSLMVDLPAAVCVNGGPHVSFKVGRGLQDSAGGVLRRFDFQIAAETKAFPGGSSPGPSYSGKVATAPDGLRVVTYNGEIVGDPFSVPDEFRKVLDGFRQLYTLPLWVASYELETNIDQDRGRFRITFTEMAYPLPHEGTDDDKGYKNFAVEGSASLRRDRDEQMRLVRSWTFDLLVVGDVDKLLTVLRPNLPILRETVSVTVFPHQRVSAEFVTVTGGNGNALMNWQAAFHYEHPAVNVYRQLTYPGVDPVLVRKERTVGRLTFSGSMTGAGVFIDPPPAPKDLVLLEQPRRSWVVVNEIERRTDFSYVMAIGPGDRVTPAELLAALQRPVDKIPPIPPYLDPSKNPVPALGGK